MKQENKQLKEEIVNNQIHNKNKQNKIKKGNRKQNQSHDWVLFGNKNRRNTRNEQSVC